MPNTTPANTQKHNENTNKSSHTGQRDL